ATFLAREAGAENPSPRGNSSGHLGWHNGFRNGKSAGNHVVGPSHASRHISTEMMNGPVTRKAHLSVPAVEHQHFDTNFIRTAVCEARFPTLYEIDGPRPPTEFAHALRQEYPVHNLG